MPNDKATPDAKTDKAAAREAAAQQRQAERDAASALHHAFDAGRSSVPVKAVSGFKAYRAALGALRCNKPSERQAAALAVACLASGQRITDGATFPRKFQHRGGAFAIENGAAADCVSVGLADYDTDAETFTLSSGAAKTIAGLLGKTGAKLPAIAKLS